VGLGDQSIKNIYDYTYALDAVTIGEPTQITIIRGTETLSLPITPMARP
jgi:S1-C subfamily serine protease